MRMRPTLARLLAVLLLMQWGTAFAHCLRMEPDAASTLHTVICTPDGLVTLALPADGPPRGDDRDAEAERHKHKATAALCPACNGAAQAALTPPPLLLARIAPVLRLPLPAALRRPPSPPPFRALPETRAPPWA